ncbi:hypothetical protein AB0D90_28285 [Streptomyces althioticus]|uniref:hypothetical protein n=1 Tax=Streptomyces althioticus TaxID=83380 RepID=UPI0033D6FE2F
MSLLLIFALVLAGVGVYMSYRDPKLGAAILVGLGIVTVLFLIWEKDPSLFDELETPPASTVPADPGRADPGVVSPSLPAVSTESSAPHF